MEMPIVRGIVVSIRGSVQRFVPTAYHRLSVGTSGQVNGW